MHWLQVQGGEHLLVASIDPELEYVKRSFCILEAYAACGNSPQDAIADGDDQGRRDLLLERLQALAMCGYNLQLWLGYLRLWGMPPDRPLRPGGVRRPRPRK